MRRRDERAVIAAAEEVLVAHSTEASIEYLVRAIFREGLADVVAPLVDAVEHLHERLKRLEARL